MKYKKKRQKGKARYKRNKKTKKNIGSWEKQLERDELEIARRMKKSEELEKEKYFNGTEL